MVEAVGLRITTVRDAQGVLWYIRNGEIIRVGNKSQGWAMVMVDMPIGFAGVEEATAVLRDGGRRRWPRTRELRADFIEPPEVLGVEQITVDGAVVRTTAKTHRRGAVRGRPGAAPPAGRGAGGAGHPGEDRGDPDVSRARRRRRTRRRANDAGTGGAT